MADFHIFDMDGTLVDNDCDVSWKLFLVAAGFAPKSDIELAHKYYDEDGMPLYFLDYSTDDYRPLLNN